MRKNNASLSTHDLRTIKVYDAEDTVDMFGEDYLIEFGTYVPEDLIARYKKCHEEYLLIQKQLDAFKEEQDR